MENTLEHDMQTGLLLVFTGVRVSISLRPFLRFPIVVVVVFWDLYWGPLFMETTKQRYRAWG